MSQHEGEKARKELLQTLARVSDKHPQLRICQSLENTVPHDARGHRKRDLFYTEDSQFNQWLLDFEQRIDQSADMQTFALVATNSIEHTQTFARASSQLVGYP